MRIYPIRRKEVQKNTQTYTIENIDYMFDKNVFKDLFNRMRKGRNVAEFEEELANEIGVGISTVHSWRVGDNSPSDIEKVKDLATSLKLSSYEVLLKKKEGIKTMQISERQKDSIKRIYDAIIDFFDYFEQTNGFNDLWFDICDRYNNSRQIEDALYRIADKAQQKCILVVKKEYIELFRLDLYEQLEEFVYDYLLDMYNAKLSYGYRFEAGVENVDGSRYTLTTEEELTKAYKIVNELLEPYM